MKKSLLCKKVGGGGGGGGGGAGGMAPGLSVAVAHEII